MANVMIVDDAPFMRKLIENALAPKGHKVVALAEDGVMAVQGYKDSDPDVVTMDITMKRKNGLEALKEILAFDPKARIVMVSALGQEKLLTEAIKAGARGYIIKPFKPEVLQKAVRDALR